LISLAAVALREAAYLARHHGKATPLLAGAGGFHGGVERQDVGLERNALDHADDVGNLLAARVDARHRFDHAAHHLTTLDGDVRCVDCQRAGLTRVVGVLANDAGQLFHAGSGFFQRAGLLLGALRQVRIAGGNLLGGAGNRVRTRAHLADDPLQARLHCSHRMHEARGFIAAAGRRAALHTRGEIARSHALEHLDGALQRTYHRAAEHTARQDRQHQRRRQQASRDPDTQGVARLRVLEARLAIRKAGLDQRPERRVIGGKELWHLRRVQVAIGGEVAVLERGNGRLQRGLDELGARDVSGLQLGAIGLGHGQLHELAPCFVGRVDHGVRVRQQLLEFLGRRHRIKVGQVNARPQQIDGVLGQQVQALGIFQIHGAQVGVRCPAGDDAGRTHHRNHRGKHRDQHRQPCSNTRIHPLPHMLSSCMVGPSSVVLSCLVCTARPVPGSLPTGANGSGQQK